MELVAIKIAHQLEKYTSIIDCLHLIHNGGIMERIDKRRTSFIADSPLIPHWLDMEKIQSSQHEEEWGQRDNIRIDTLTIQDGKPHLNFTNLT